MPFKFADPDSPSRPLHLLDPATLADWLASQPAAVATWLTDCGFAGSESEFCLLPDSSGACVGAVFGLGPISARDRSRFVVAQAATRLPVGAWRIETPFDPLDATEAALAWLLAGYGFTRYAGTPKDIARLVAPDGVDVARLEAIAAGEAMTRDLINTPASDMGPAELEAVVRDLAIEFQADFGCIVGDALLEANFPLIHAVGRASPRAPRLIDMRWGQSGPSVTLVGKGVIFDTGGLDIKPAASMGLMKKDMGGAATVLGLARMIMALNLPVRLRVLIPAVENAISGNAFRPQDILTSRKGLTVEINNTDAEGRLVLADALTLAGEETPDLLVSMATLTGAARVAVGPDLAPFFTDDSGLAQALYQGANAARDPVWQLPFHAPYESMIEPGIADLDNAPKGGFAGAITAALFLRRFVPAGQRYAHFDIYGWQPLAAPARPKGGVGQGARALLEALPTVLDLPRP